MCLGQNTSKQKHRNKKKERTQRRDAVNSNATNDTHNYSDRGAKMTRIGHGSFFKVSNPPKTSYCNTIAQGRRCASHVSVTGTVFTPRLSSFHSASNSSRLFALSGCMYTFVTASTPCQKEKKYWVHYRHVPQRQETTKNKTSSRQAETRSRRGNDCFKPCASWRYTAAVTLTLFRRQCNGSGTFKRQQCLAGAAWEAQYNRRGQKQHAVPFYSSIQPTAAEQVPRTSPRLV